MLTGSQRPMTSSFTDAKLNLYQSLLYALDDASCVVKNANVLPPFASICFPIARYPRDELV